ncbi:64_t:CDS:2 [Cetraspora pellucida]|uniref:64_t:CDS:1 n=1 Tax=Cetraspora pellucida TaxID=1433469 RepID=A0A9N9AJ47_9GLOM|nr:64_t:CDS:2 [Cetraspora pellucida]
MTTTKTSAITNRSNSNSKSPSYNLKTRGHTRVQRVKVTTVGKPANSLEKQQHRSCLRCKESDISVKTLTERVGRIEDLVNALSKTTQNLFKRDDKLSWRLKGLDLTTCSLEELQKLVITTTNIMISQNNKLNTATPSSLTVPNVSRKSGRKHAYKQQTTSPIIHSEPIEDASHVTFATPVPPKLGRTKSIRKDSGYVESKQTD